MLGSDAHILQSVRSGCLQGMRTMAKQWACLAELDTVDTRVLTT